MDEDLGTRTPEESLRTGLLDVADVDLPAGADVSLCGPLPFMAGVRSALLDRGVAAADIHYEVFGPDRDLASA